MTKNLIRWGLAFTILLNVLVVSAQQITIQGKIVDQITKQPIPFANIAAWGRDSVLLKGTVTSEQGDFSLPLASHQFLLRVQSVGFQTYQEAIAIPAQETAWVVPVISLKTAETALDEVKVQGQRATNTIQLDKQVFTTKQFQNAAGGTGLDLLKRLPAITVNIEGGVSLRGNEAILVLINGKPTNRTATDVLAQLAANQIEQVEISSSPSARYDSDGKAGFINIITKQSFNQGWGLTLNGLAAGIDPPRYGGDATLTYTARRWNVYVAADYRRYDINGFRSGTVRTLYRDTLTYLPSAGIRDWQDWQYGVRVGLSYTITPRSMLNVGFYAGHKRTDRIANLHYQDYTRTDSPADLFATSFPTQPLRQFYNHNLFSRTGAFQTLNADYTYSFKDKSKLTLLGLYEYSILGGPLRNTNQPEGSQLLTLQERSDERSPLTAWRGQLDWSKPLANGQRLELGYQWRRVAYQGEFNFERVNNATDQWEADPVFADQLSLIQQIYGGYVQWTKEGKRLALNAGLRLESTDRTLTHQAEPQPYRYQALNLFPSFQALWKLTSTQSLRLGYNRRIDRPTAKALSPFKNHRHAEAIELGDPTLRPELSDVVEAAYSQSWQRLSWSVTGYLNRTQDRIFRVNAPYSRTILLRLYTNAGLATSVGGEFSLDWKPLRWWRFNGAGNLYQLTISGTYDGLSIDQRSVNYNVNTNTTIDLTKALRFQYDVAYVSRTATSQGFDTGLLLSNAGLRYSLVAATLGLQLTNVFNTNTQTIMTQGPTFFSATEYRKYDRVLQLTISCRFNESTKKIKATKTEYGEKDF